MKQKMSHYCSTGENPLELNKLNERMDYLLQGHPYVKTAIDVACWDILGKVNILYCRGSSDSSRRL